MDKDYKKLNSKEKEIVEMYITARQFKNAILINEMVTLPNNVNGELTKKLGKNLGFDIFETKGNRIQNKIYPFLVNKAFACEVYLKLILKIEHTDLDELVNSKVIRRNEKHSLFSLLNLIHYDLIGLIVNSYNNEVTKKDIEEEIKKIADAFMKWRYIYEYLNNQDNIVNYVFLDKFCETLDIYTKTIIKSELNYDVNNDIR